jgi:hypothetical protein
MKANAARQQRPQIPQRLNQTLNNPKAHGDGVLLVGVGGLVRSSSCVVNDVHKVRHLALNLESGERSVEAAIKVMGRSFARCLTSC